MEPLGQAARALVVADNPLKRSLDLLILEIKARRDEVGSLDLTIETLREQLADFESQYRTRLAAEHATLSRIQSLCRHLERWTELLRAPDATIARAAQRIDTQRQAQLRDHAASRDDPTDATAANGETAASEPTQHEAHKEAYKDALKRAYRALARRYHPDLAATEQEQIALSRRMAQINEAYRIGDLPRLETWARQAEGAEIGDGDTLSLGEQMALLTQRLAFFDTVVANLREEIADLERCPTCQLWRQLQDAATNGRDLIAELRDDLQARAARATADIRIAIRELETEVRRYNRHEAAPPGALTAETTSRALGKLFDPVADKHLVRLGLEQIASMQISQAGRQMAQWLEEQASRGEQPALLHLLLFAHISELSPFPLDGLDSYEHLAVRLQALAATDDDDQAKPAPSLERLLVDADALVEFGVRRVTHNLVRTGLRFRSEALREAVPFSLQALAVRGQFKRVLGVLGEATTCSACAQATFTVPLYRTRGLDNLRAAVCPLCGHCLHRYWMPKGKDVQAVLNPSFLDHEIIFEASFRLAQAHLAMQFVPVQRAGMSVGKLKRDFVAETFQRYGLRMIKAQHVELHQDRHAVADKTLIDRLTSLQFGVRFKPEAPLRLTDAVATLRHRIRNRFTDG